MPSWLSTLLAPVSVDEFLSSYWLKQYLFCPGPRDRFSELLSWTVLNSILEHHWRETFRFRLALRGRDIDPCLYADLDGFTPRIRAKDVADHLRRGATLSFDAIDELHAPLTHLAESFETFFRGGTKINIYAAWRSMHGLDLHRDNQEIFILQLDGRKRWLLYGGSVEGIDRAALGESSVPPAGAVLDEILQPGDLLYIPRGCYHLAVPMNEPALHLTIGIKNPRGKDVARWIADRVSASAIADRDVPYHGGAEERIRYSDALRSELLRGLDADLVEQYFSETGSNFKPRPTFGLPWSVMPDALPEGRDFLVKLSPSHILVNTGSNGGAVEVLCGRRKCRFPHAMHWILDGLASGAPATMSEVVESVAEHLDEQAVRLLLTMLVRQNLLTITI